MTTEERIQNLKRLVRRQRHNTRMSVDGECVQVFLYGHCIVSVDFWLGVIALNTCGHNTMTTRRRMNQVARAADLNFHVVTSNNIPLITTPDGRTDAMADGQVCFYLSGEVVYG